jgi:hypothetical protein
MQPLMIKLAIAATFTCGVLSTAHAKQPQLDFDKTFNATHAPAAAHFRAAYEAAGRTHLLEVWRSRDRHLKRRTDDAIETYVSRPTRDPEWSMVVLDLRQRIRTDIDRTNLYRVGHFVDWFGMAHGLSRPIGAYELHRIAAAPGVHRPIAPCHWYQLSNQGKTSNICWSEAMKLPLIIATLDGNAQWRMLEVDARPFSGTTFQVADEGFARNNANEDISAD